MRSGDGVELQQVYHHATNLPAALPFPRRYRPCPARQDSLRGRNQRVNLGKLGPLLAEPPRCGRRCDRDHTLSVPAQPNRPRSSVCGRNVPLPCWAGTECNPYVTDFNRGLPFLPRCHWPEPMRSLHRRKRRPILLALNGAAPRQLRASARRSRRGVSLLHAQLVFVTKFREVFTVPCSPSPRPPRAPCAPTPTTN